MSTRTYGDNFATTVVISVVYILAARHGHHRFGYGMCGFSGAIPNAEDDRLYIGAPGVFYWQGALFVQNVNEEEQRPNTPDGPAETDHSMLGKQRRRRRFGMPCIRWRAYSGRRGSSINGRTRDGRPRSASSRFSLSCRLIEHSSPLIDGDASLQAMPLPLETSTVTALMMRPSDRRRATVCWDWSVPLTNCMARVVKEGCFR